RLIAEHDAFALAARRAERAAVDLAAAALRHGAVAHRAVHDARDARRVAPVIRRLGAGTLPVDLRLNGAACGVAFGIVLSRRMHRGERHEKSEHDARHRSSDLDEMHDDLLWSSAPALMRAGVS